MTAAQIRALSPEGEIVPPDGRLRAKDPFGYIEAVYYQEADGTVREVILDEKGDTSNIRRPWRPKAGEERANYDNEKGVQGCKETVA